MSKIKMMLFASIIAGCSMFSMAARAECGPQSTPTCSEQPPPLVEPIGDVLLVVIESIQSLIP